ncbi:hypothetical protein [Polaribacter glomeratus]|uniref:Uncharacterized protein n=1 Tax=Polaribacter glomeratus TaxID=102 RepID=A0A2S7WFY8_9FLAO|nr:hypothetical protein [Polaribacter glomeratus]PQJ76517.1 hypothetical protein BTO16_11470 [Polaribacter glomeratus]TXD64185.1 hypothetical protein ESX12_15855 [Polaribacter glomeratus]
MEKDFEDIKLPLEKVEIRLQEFKNAIKIYKTKHFNRTGNNIDVVDKAVEKMTSLHYGWLYSNVKPLVPKRINKYKMASLAELCVIKIQTFILKDLKDLKETRKINADFAFFCCLSMITGMSQDTSNFLKGSSIKRVEDIFHIVKSQRLKWLECKNIDEFPVFSNGLNLFLLFELYHLRFQAIQI